MPTLRQVFPLLAAVPLACIPPPLEGCADAAGCEADPVSTGALATSMSTSTTGDASPTSDATATTGQGGEATSDALTGDGTTGGGATGSSADATTGDPSTSSTGGEALPPKVLAVDMPAKVSIAGPYAFTAVTEHAAFAHAKLDGVDLGLLTDEGDGVFSGVVRIYGSVDAGGHVLEVVAENGDLSDALGVQFDVSTPAPGSPAWTMSGPTGSRTRRVAITAEGDVFEVGTREIGGVARPAIRKRSGITGAELWPGGTIVLDNHQGEAVDVAVAPDGRLWVAMNVAETLNKWRPRIVQLDAAGKPTGVEVPTAVGQTVTGLDSDGFGGCFAVGVVGSGFGDADVVVWRMTGAGVPVLSGKAWDYVPPGFPVPHSFSDFATDIVVQEGAAWVVGFSYGKHGGDPVHTRGLLIHMDVDTGMVLDPVIIAPASNPWRQSMIYGAATHPDGVLVTGTGCNDACDVQRVETALYTPAGTRSWFRPEPSAALARGNAVAVGEHDVVIVAATVQEGTVLRGHVLGRVLYNNNELFCAPFPASKEPSEAVGAAVGPFDRIYVGGHRTFGGIPEAWALHLHP